jgi:methionyl aminopeptidase
MTQQAAEATGFKTCNGFCGHGIGKEFHMEPQIYSFPQPGQGVTLVPGMVFTVEPILTMGSGRAKILKDGWQAVDPDNKLSAQWEHTVIVTETGYEILTELKD